MSTSSFADPSIIPFKGGFFGLSTGYGAPGAWAPRAYGPWHSTGPTLVRAPHWASDANVWAADAARLAGRYVMYYSVPVHGLGEGGRCIGAAVARSPFQKFLPVRGDRPLVCPVAANARHAADGVHRTSRHPRGGVIDPSVTRVGNRIFLLYKTQGTPATIRIVPLTTSGLTTHGRSRQLLKTGDISENPVVVRHGGSYYLFTSQGYYDGCGYSTTWRRSRSLFSWQHAAAHPLLRSRSTGACGPGGADIVQSNGHHSLVFFHGWVCGKASTCSNRGVARNASARRGLYAGRLVWRRGVPHVMHLGAAFHAKKKHHPAKKKHPKRPHRAKHAKKHQKAKRKKHTKRHHATKRHAKKKRHHAAKRHRTKKRRHAAKKHHHRVKKHARRKRKHTARRTHRKR